MPQEARSPDFQVVFIASTGRSGSTLLERVLATLPDAIACGELSQFHEHVELGRFVCGCGRPLPECEFWPEVLTEAYGSDWFKVLARMGALRSAVRHFHHYREVRGASTDDVRELVALTRPLYPAIHRVSGKRVILDSSKHPLNGFIVAHALTDATQRTGEKASPLSVIHLVRDSRATAYSWQRLKFRPDAVSGPKYMKQKNALDIALFYGMVNSVIPALRRQAIRSAFLRYEDLTREPAERAGKMLRELDLPAEAVVPSLRHGAVTVKPDHTVMGNPMRFHHGEVPITQDDAWRTALSGRDRALVTSLTLPWLVRYGYWPRRAA